MNFYSSYRIIFPALTVLSITSCSASTIRVSGKIDPDSTQGSELPLTYKIVESDTQKVYFCELNELPKAIMLERIAVTGEPKPTQSSDIKLENCKLTT
jgi:hypothetical protein